MREEIIRGLIDTMKIGGRLRVTAVGCVFAVGEGETSTEVIFWDDISGQPLNTEEVIKARAAEIENFYQYSVYSKVP